MESLKLETFLSADKDLEINQYRVLGGIKEYHTELTKKRVYPTLAELIHLASILENIMDNKSKLKDSFPRQVKDFDLKNHTVTFETLGKFAPDVEFLFELIEWAYPLIRNEIEEAIVLYDFVEKNIEIDHVGIVPLNKDEGYFLIDDHEDAKIQVHRFESSIFTSETEKYRSLKTKLIKEIEKALIERSPESIKLDLIKQYTDLPNPATFICDTDLDFPFNETIFPIAKRKLMAMVAS
jgi:hypothetical protein